MRRAVKCSITFSGITCMRGFLKKRRWLCLLTSNPCMNRVLEVEFPWPNGGGLEFCETESGFACGVESLEV